MKYFFNFLKVVIILTLATWLFPKTFFAEGLKEICVVAAILTVVQMAISICSSFLFGVGIFFAAISVEISTLYIFAVIFCLIFSNTITLSIINSHYSGFGINGFIPLLILAIIVSCLQKSSKNKF